MEKRNFSQLTVGKQYLSRDGKEYTCIASNPYYDERYPSDEYICVEKETGGVLYVSRNGDWRTSTLPSRNDLVTERREPVRRWLNIYRRNGNLYMVGRLMPERKDHADRAIPKFGRRVACIPIEFREGEGLDEVTG